jgi:hypothetical protein
MKNKKNVTRAHSAKLSISTKYEIKTGQLKQLQILSLTIHKHTQHSADKGCIIVCMATYCTYIIYYTCQLMVICFFTARGQTQTEKD